MNRRTPPERGVPEPKKPRGSAVCLSGGGVRSAAFSIGLLQALDRALGRTPHRSGESRNFSYLSTVSGGAFAGAWYRTRLADLGQDLAGEEPLLEEVEKLRKKGGYLNLPGYQLVLLFLAKLLVYWLFLIPAIFTTLLLLEGLWSGLELAWQNLESRASGVAAAGPAVMLVAGAFTLLLALQYELGRRWVAWLTALVLASWAVDGLISSAGGLALLAAGGLPAAALALLLQASQSPLMRSLTRRLGAARLTRLAAWLGIGLLIALCAWMLRTSLELFGGYLDPVANSVYLGWLPPPLRLVPPLVAFTLLAGLMPVKWISLAGFYRERIREGFRLGKTTLDKLADAPALIVNTAASADEKDYREWDERKAAAFAWTPAGYVNLLKLTEKEEGQESGRPAHQRSVLEEEPYEANGIDLSLAVATSAAVAGPRMGSYTARAVGLLLTFFNVRLGQWFHLEGKNPFTMSGRIWGLLGAEVFGLKRKNWVHLTDGGHFENLGLYEVVRRRCRYVLVVDAGCDPKYRFSDLANAVRKIRIDLGVEIEIDGLRWTEEGSVLESPSSGQRQRVYGGTIRYPKGDSREVFDYGKIVYVKTALIGDEPADVAGYADLHPAFPHESTTDQWFSESQFESYRRLGEFTIDAALQHYEDAKELWAPSSSRSSDDKRRPSADAVLVEQLREAGMIAGRAELRPTHGGAIVCGAAQSDADAPPQEQRSPRWLLVMASGGGSWVLPKGHIERGETPFGCARRELGEEAGIEWPSRERDGRPVEHSGVIYDVFRRGGEELRVAYYLLDLRDETAACRHPEDPFPDGLRTENPIEDRPEVWITAEEYARALRKHPATPKELKEALGEGIGPSEGKRPYDDRLAHARQLIPGLLWILEEAERTLNEDTAL